MTDEQPWTDGECVDCGRESRINDDGLCLICVDLQREQAIDSQRESIKETVKEDFGAKAVSGKGNGAQRRLHVPDPNSDDEPLCSTTGSWSTRPLSFHPQDKPWCERCIRVLAEADRQ